MNTSTDDEFVANSVVSFVVSWLSCRLSALTLIPVGAFELRNGRLQQLTVGVVREQHANLLGLGLRSHACSDGQGTERDQSFLMTFLIHPP